MSDHILWCAYVGGKRIGWGTGPMDQDPAVIASTFRAEGHKHRASEITIKRAIGGGKYETTIHQAKIAA